LIGAEKGNLVVDRYVFASLSDASTTSQKGDKSKAEGQRRKGEKVGAQPK
jgi:hypothetical protein